MYVATSRCRQRTIIYPPRNLTQCYTWLHVEELKIDQHFPFPDVFILKQPLGITPPRKVTQNGPQKFVLRENAHFILWVHRLGHGEFFHNFRFLFVIFTVTRLIIAVIITPVQLIQNPE